MTDEEFNVLDEVYFVTPYKTIVGELAISNEDLKKALTGLLEKKYVIQMKYDPQQQDFVRCEKADMEDLEKFHYLATKEGLLAHNT